MGDFDFSSPPPERASAPLRRYTLTTEQEKDFKDAFALFDTEGTGMITMKQLPQVMRTVAHNPMDHELQDINNEFDPEGTNELILNDFLVIMSRRCKDLTPEDEVIMAFKVFDKEGNGYIAESEFRHIMMNLGDKLNEDDVEDIIRDANSDTEGNINYTNFVMMMAER